MDNRLENFYYFKNETNIGPDRNFVKVLSLAKGTYSHLLGDDDFVRDDYLSKTLPVLKDHTFCYLSFSLPSGTTKLNGSSSKGGIISLSKSQIPLFLQALSTGFVYMTFMIFNTEVLKKVQNQERFVGTYFIQSYLCLECIKSSPLPFGLFDYNPVINGANAMLGYNVYDVFGKHYFSLLLFGVGNKSKARKIYKRCGLPWFTQFLPNLRLNGYRQKMSWSAFVFLSSFPKAWFSIFPFVFSPRWLIKIFWFPLLSFYRSLRKHNNLGSDGA